MSDPGENSYETRDVRIDKWLWAARFYKTRALAIQAVELGKVTINGERTKPAKSLHVGDTLAIRRGPYRTVVVVRELSLRRGPAADAQNLYQETAESIAARAEVAQRLHQDARPDARGRPTKRDRRQVAAFMRANYEP